MRLKSKVEIDDDGYVVAEREQIPAFYLAPEKMIVEECVIDGDDENNIKCIVRNIVPVALRTANGDIETSLMAALASFKGIIIISIIIIIIINVIIIVIIIIIIIITIIIIIIIIIITTTIRTTKKIRFILVVRYCYN